MYLSYSGGCFAVINSNRSTRAGARGEKRYQFESLQVLV